MTQICEVDIVLDGVEKNIDWQLGDVHHVAKFVVTILEHLWRVTAINVLKVFDDFIDCASERVACPVADGRKVGSRDGLNNLLDESLLDALYFTEETDCFVVSSFHDDRDCIGRGCRNSERSWMDRSNKWLIG